MALKIQFLRLVHSFCSNSEYKEAMLTPVELKELEDIPLAAAALPLPIRQALDGTGTSREDPDGPVGPGASAEDRMVLMTDTFFQKEGPSWHPTQKQMCSGTNGLLTKIAEVLTKELPHSTIRYA